MQYEFTPAAERALQAAAAWTLADEAAPLHPAEVLLGLLAEPECRAALLLAGIGVDAHAVRQRWPAMRRLALPDAGRARQFVGPWADSLREAAQRLYDYPPPRTLATEHLLLGLAIANHEVASWLRGLGLNVSALEVEIHRWAGHDVGLLPLNLDDPVPCDSHDVAAVAPDASAKARSQGVNSNEAAPSERIGVLRIMDAAANRGSEALRVVEDYTRFVLDDAHLTALAKTLRHDLAEALRAFSSAERHAARDTQADVGTLISSASENSRTTAADVVAAAFKRAEQALRSLEEYAKIAEPGVASRFEQLRYRTYTLERATDVTRTSLERLRNARLYVLVDGQLSIPALEALVRSLVEAGVHVLQLREKRLADRELLERARIFAQAVQGSDTLFIMNDRSDLAVLSGADGVHVGQEELSVKDARRIVGPKALVGVSTHSIDQARAAVLAGANYLGVGPTFPSGTKSFDAFPGTALSSAVAAEIRLPAFAIGGITAANLGEVLDTGVTRVCVGGSITGATDPSKAARELLERLSSRPCVTPKA